MCVRVRYNLQGIIPQGKNSHSISDPQSHSNTQNTAFVVIRRNGDSWGPLIAEWMLVGSGDPQCTYSIFKPCIGPVMCMVSQVYLLMIRYLGVKQVALTFSPVFWYSLSFVYVPTLYTSFVYKDIINKREISNIVVYLTRYTLSVYCTNVV